MKTKTSGTGEGVIHNAGGDKHAYLGHFRSKKVMECGHNQGAPGGALDVSHPALNPISNPGGLTAAAGRPTARIGGNVGSPVSSASPMAPVSQPAVDRIGGNMGAAGAQQGGATMTPAAGAVQGLGQLLSGGVGGPVKNRSSGAANASKRATGAKKSSMPMKRGGGGMNMERGGGVKTPAVGANTTPSAGPRAALQSATDVLRNARQGVRNSVRGGKPAKPKKMPRM